MAPDDRDSSHRLALYQALQEAPYTFDFFQALRRIECAHPRQPRIGEAHHPRDDAVRFGQDVSTAFAPTTLTQFVPGEGGSPPRLLQAFFGLFGPNGPLPLDWTERARDRLLNNADPTMVRFLEIFQHRLISLFYRAWIQAQPAILADRLDADRFAMYIGVLIGYSVPAMRGRDTVTDAAKLSFAGLLGRQSRNSDGLEAILRDYFQTQVCIIPLVAHWMQLPRQLQTRLGDRESASLGRGAVIGERVWDVQSKFRVRIGPLPLARYESFLPDQNSFQRLVDWIRNYVGTEFRWDCQLVLARKEVPLLLLGYNGRLGWTTWLGLGTRLADKDPDDLVLAGR